MRDISIDQITIKFGDKLLLDKTKLVISGKERYGLMGRMVQESHIY
jgi:ATPase subunit of ABC transporter with duplicated ATPase domains